MVFQKYDTPTPQNNTELKWNNPNKEISLSSLAVK
jgi:hypothetical protein